MRAVINGHIVWVHIVPKGYLYRLINGRPTYVPPTEWYSEQPLVPPNAR
jgi:hypothetical protein